MCMLLFIQVRAAVGSLALVHHQQSEWARSLVNRSNRHANYLRQRHLSARIKGGLELFSGIYSTHSHTYTLSQFSVLFLCLYIYICRSKNICINRERSVIMYKDTRGTWSVKCCRHYETIRSLVWGINECAVCCSSREQIKSYGGESSFGPTRFSRLYTFFLICLMEGSWSKWRSK